MRPCTLHQFDPIHWHVDKATPDRGQRSPAGRIKHDAIMIS